MSKDIVIQENGVAQTLNTISIVETKGQESGSVDWVPEDEVKLGKVTIKANGEVKAKDSGYYAFSEVTVKVPADAEGNRAVGKKKDGSWVVVTRGSGGILVEKGLPTYISIVTPPTKTSYAQGEAISLAGIVVKAYYSDNTEYCVLYESQLSYSPLTATGNTVTVGWNRDGDKQALTTTFNITVT